MCMRPCRCNDSMSNFCVANIKWQETSGESRQGLANRHGKALPVFEACLLQSKGTASNHLLRICKVGANMTCGKQLCNCTVDGNLVPAAS